MAKHIHPSIDAVFNHSQVFIELLARRRQALVTLMKDMEILAYLELIIWWEWKVMRTDYT
jgi:hypothetical protein